MNAKDDKLLAEARAALNRKAETLDDAVLARLRAARLAATEATDRSRRSGSWLSPIPGTGSSWALSRTMGGMVAASLVFAVAMTVWLANPVVPGGNLEDLEILAANENPEFYQDLDFYLWLETRSTRAG